MHWIPSRCYRISLLFFLSPLLGLAQDHDSAGKGREQAPWYVERFTATMGFFAPVTNTSIAVSVTGQSPNGQVDFQKDLGYPSTITTFIAGAKWRISRRSRVVFNFYNVNRGGTSTLNDDFVFKEDTFHANSAVNTFFNTSIFQIAYGYSILAKPKYELGLEIGTHLIKGYTGISLANLAGSANRKNDFTFTAPLPDLGIWGGMSFSPRFAATLDFDYLSLSSGGNSGSVLAYNLAFSYKLADHFILSLGLTGLNFDMTIKESDATGQFKWGYNGPNLLASYVFGKKSWRH